MTPPLQLRPRRRAMPEKIRALPLSEWPEADRHAWDRACVAPQRLRPGGAAGRMKASTQVSLLRAYGYLLEFCHRSRLFDQTAAAAGHVTPEIIDAFLCELRDRVGSVTRVIYVSRIQTITRILAPGDDLSWLKEIEGDLRYEARPRPKYHRIVSAERLLKLGLDLIRRGETSKQLTLLARARLVRDGLMISLLALCPIRLRNLADLRIGRQLRLIGDRWWIILESAETKSARPDERPIPEILAEAIHRWIGQWRTLFHPCDDAFWPPSRVDRLPIPMSATLLQRSHGGNWAFRSTLTSFGIAPSTPWRPPLGTAWASHPAFSSTLTNALWRSITTRALRSAQLGDISRSLTN
jgi:integrase/recombinase XerD